MPATLSHQLLRQAIKRQASDIHFHPFKCHVKIFFRIHGTRTPFKRISLNAYKLLLTYFKFTSSMDIGENRKPQNGTIMYEHESITYALRLSTLPLKTFESLAIRILPQEQSLTLDQLFLFPYQIRQLKQAIGKEAGVILLTGPTGSGKSTTLYALLETMIYEHSLQAITLEDPIEKKLDYTLQVQINERAGITYDAGLKAALRHDPDLIMIGEIRDQQTAHFAFRAALTGHLVLSTLHAKNATGTIQRLLEMELSKTELDQSLLAIISLQLLPIIQQNQIKRRAAIFEMLNDQQIENILKGRNISRPLETFEHLRKKAYSYGFISKETFLQYENEHFSR